MLDQRFQSAEEALHEIGTFLVDQKMVQPQYINSLIQRHKKYGVYIGGNFVALPHGEEEADKWINEEGICLVQVPDGVDFGDAKESKVTTILVCGCSQRKAVCHACKKLLFFVQISKMYNY